MIDLAPEHRQIVMGVLAPTVAVIDPSLGVRLARDRAGATLLRSGLGDDVGRPLTSDEIAMLREVFEESDLPYCVDIVDWRAIDPRFRDLIAAQRMLLPGGRPSAVGQVQSERASDG